MALDLGRGDAVEAPAEPALSEGSERPEGIPEKFWDAKAGTVRTEALLKSYVELERRMSRMLPHPEDSEGDEAGRLREALGIPSSPDDYAIEVGSEVVEVDPELNRRLHEAGFNNQQAQLVYALAEEYLLPAISEAYGEVFVQQELGRLQQTFGGAEQWQATAEQLRTWGKANLAPDVYETLASSYDGVMALSAMMQAREPKVMHGDGTATAADEPTLRRMMQDPRYWRDRDPGFVAEVTRGFERLYRE
ncbi:MAG: hypothetical protein EA356_06430 [Geminicoccaceae bacterium]|nr:MAG: hypothetical protein EA356_06430 [Geminicoccaceae bacterium]